MNRKEREQLVVFKKLEAGEVNQMVAAKILKITTRWLRTKYRRYKIHGVSAITHQARNKPSMRCLNPVDRAFAVELLKSDWLGFGPTFAAEKLKEIYNKTISHETMRKIMIEENLWFSKGHRMNHRKRRNRRDIIGLMIQLDGSPHDWLEGRGPQCTLLVFIDDATSKILWLEFVETDSFQGVAAATKHYFEKYGRPGCFYVDFGSVFSVNLNNPDREKITQFKRAMKELDVEIIHAHSPQAKGRVERANQTLQDRLVKEMRLAHISSIEAANEFIRRSNFLETHNDKFAIVPAQKGNAHRSIEGYNLNNILCIKEDRVLTNDYTISFKSRVLQLSKQQPTIIRPKDRIMVHQHLDQTLSLHIRKCTLNFKEIDMPKKQRISPVDYVNHYGAEEDSAWRSLYGNPSLQHHTTHEKRNFSCC